MNLRLNRSNWFLVIPTIIFGIWASWALYQMHAAGDARRAVQIVGEYRAEGRPTLAEFLGRRGPVACSSAVVSKFYGTMDVTCDVGERPPRSYVWRVDVLQEIFAPADEATRELMAEYQPSLFARPKDAGQTAGSTS
ncbi:MAG: hypothetical protein PVJ49_17230 [Acidobacteriota bacterium]|jgi:hypothetical protein